MIGDHDYPHYPVNCRGCKIIELEKECDQLHAELDRAQIMYALAADDRDQLRAENARLGEQLRHALIMKGKLVVAKDELEEENARLKEECEHFKDAWKTSVGLGAQIRQRSEEAEKLLDEAEEAIDKVLADTNTIFVEDDATEPAEMFLRKLRARKEGTG